MTGITRQTGQRLLTFLLCGLLAGCSRSDRPENTHPQGQRIITLAPAYTQHLYLLGVEDRLIANTTYCNHPAAAKEKEKIGNVTQVNVEKVIALQPTLVLASRLTSPRQRAAIERAGIKVVVVPYHHNYDDLCKSFLMLAKQVGKTAEAETIVQNTRRDIKQIQANVADSEPCSVFVQIGCRPLFSAPRGTFVGDMIEMAGGSNIVGNVSSGLYSVEQVIKNNPDVILVSTMDGQSHEAMAYWQQYPTISAVKTDRLHAIDSYDLCSPTPVTFVSTLKEIANLLHPPR